MVLAAYFVKWSDINTEGKWRVQANVLNMFIDTADENIKYCPVCCGAILWGEALPIAAPTTLRTGNDRLYFCSSKYLEVPRSALSCFDLKRKERNE